MQKLKKDTKDTTTVQDSVRYLNGHVEGLSTRYVQHIIPTNIFENDKSPLTFRPQMKLYQASCNV
jgi:hypothetical protein